MIEKLLAILQSKYRLTELDVGDMKILKAGGMTFRVKAYHAEGLGHVSVMRAKGFFGLMKMDTLMIHPKDLDLPLYSYDRIHAMGNDTLIVELYDTLLTTLDCSALQEVKNRYAALPERDPGEHWYDGIKLPESISKKGKKAHTAALDALTAEHLEAYLSGGGTGFGRSCQTGQNFALCRRFADKGRPFYRCLQKGTRRRENSRTFQKGSLWNTGVLN